MRDQFYVNNYEFNYATKIGLITLLGLNFSPCFCCEGEKKKRVFSKWCVFVSKGLASLTNTRKGLIFTWVASNKYCFNISGHMVLIILHVFSAVPFTSIFQPDGLNLCDL